MAVVVLQALCMNEISHHQHQTVNVILEIFDALMSLLNSGLLGLLGRHEPQMVCE